MALQILIAVISIGVVIAIVTYATWLFGHRLRAGASKGKSFREWVKNLFEAFWGL
jgi:hypothetical protein